MNTNKKYPSKTIAIVLCCLLSIWSIHNRLQHTLPLSGNIDFPIFVDYASQFLTTGMIYNRDLDSYGSGAAVYKFPPLSGSILVIALKAGITPKALIKIGAILQLSAFTGGILWLTLIFLSQKKIFAFVLALYLISALLPTLEENLTRLQLEPALFFLSIIAVICVYKDNNFIAGLAIAIATMLKIYPVMALLFFMVTRQISVFYGFAVGLILASCFSLLTLGYSEHYFYISDILPILLTEIPLATLENISIERLLIIAGLSAPYITLVTKIILLAPLVFSYKLLKNIEVIEDGQTRKKLKALIFSMFIPFTLAGMKTFLWNYSLLLAIPLTILACLLLNNTKTIKSRTEIWPLAGLLLVIACVHIPAATITDYHFYDSKFEKILALWLVMAITPILIIALSWHTINLRIKKARTITDTGF